jgi:hypothetical protein
MFELGPREQRVIEPVEGQAWIRFGCGAAFIDDGKRTLPSLEVEPPAAEQGKVLRVLPLDEVDACISTDLAAYFPVFMLPGIEIVQGGDAWHQGEGDVAEHGHEAGIPLEDIFVERGIDERRDEGASRRRIAKVVERQLPGFPVQFNPSGLLVIEGGGEPIPEIREPGERRMATGGDALTVHRGTLSCQHTVVKQPARAAHVPEKT